MFLYPLGMRFPSAAVRVNSGRGSGTTVVDNMRGLGHLLHSLLVDSGLAWVQFGMYLFHLETDSCCPPEPKALWVGQSPTLDGSPGHRVT